MTSRPSGFPAVANRRPPAQLGSGPFSIIAVTLFTAAMLFQPPAYSAGKAAAARNGGASDIARLEQGFWVCDYLGTKQGADMQQAETCGANFEELKKTKFGGDFEKLLEWWRLNKIAQHKALASIGSARD